MPDETKKPATPPTPPSGGVHVLVGAPQEWTLPEFTIEIGDKKNRSVLFTPTKEVLRGWWKRQYLESDELSEGISMMPDLPGMHVTVQAKRRRTRIHDPLADPANEALLATAKAAHKRIWNTDGRPNDEQVREGHNNNNLKTWVYWCIRLVQSKQAVLVAGELPTMAQLEGQPGQASCSTYDYSAATKKVRDSVLEPTT